jgi:hypothetical protein
MGRAKLNWIDTVTGGFVDEASKEQQTSPIGEAGRTRRLSNKILIAYRRSCEQGDYDIAKRLLCVLEMVLAPPVTGDQKTWHDMDAMVAAYERLWHLRHPDALPWGSIAEATAPPPRH